MRIFTHVFYPDADRGHFFFKAKNDPGNRIFVSEESVRLAKKDLYGFNFADAAFAARLIK
jgi:hypothetical protein